MGFSDFVHLRVHSAYSLSEGAIRVPELADLCQRHHMPAVAVTDRNNMFGTLVFSETMCGAGIQPIIGCTLALSAPASEEVHARTPPPDWLVLLAKDEIGYGHLMKLVSKAHLGVDVMTAPQISMADLAANQEGLIALTGAGEGPLARLLLEQRPDAARALLGQLKAVFGDRLYVEIARHGTDRERQIEESLLDLAFDQDVPLVATNQCFFADAKQFQAHDALICIAESTVVANPERRRFNPEFRFKSAEEMKQLFNDLPEALENTLVIAQRCAVKSPLRAPILPNFAEQAGKSEADLLRQMAAQGLQARLDGIGIAGDAATPYRQRLEHELAIIGQMGFPGYFLIVADFIQWTKAQNIPVGPGRGSGAGSLVAWALKITDLDPLRFGLLFERFLNPERVSMPDFDIDFCQDRRDEVIRYVQQRYGHDQVAQIITFGKLQARAVLRDVGRVLGLGRGEVDGLAKLVPNNPANPVTLQQAIDGEPKLQQAMRQPDLRSLFDIALALEGLYRHASTHAAGVVIGDRPLDQLIPLYRDPRSDMPVTQFDMAWVEKAGLVKFDFLGLKTLSVLRAALEHIRLRGIELSLEALPFDDPATYAMLGRGDSAGIFQLESDGMRNVLTALKPDKLEDIIALVALYRPGPMDNIPSFIARKHGKEEIDYLHPWLEDVLKETYGVIIYQEQVMQIAQILASYSLGEADLLRRAMGKKKKEEMDKQRERFVSGARDKGVDGAKASAIFDLVAKFAGYGFNKSHAAAYAVIAYQTAYLKANYPVEFLAASMTYDMQNTDKLAGFVFEARRLGIPVLTPDVNASGVDFEVEAVDPATMEDAPQAARGRAIRYALAAIKNVGEAAMTRLVEVRQQDGRFKDLYDLATRLEPAALNKRLLENLIRAGALDGLEPNRARSLEAIELLLRASHDSHERRGSNQVNLFDDITLQSALPALPDIAAMDPAAALEEERAAIGFYLSAHPLDAYGAQLAAQDVKPAAAVLAAFKGEARVARLAGAISGIAERRTKRGRPFVSLTLTDQGGAYEVTFFDEPMDAARRLAHAGGPVIMTVDIERMNGGDRINLTGRAIASLDAVAAHQTSAVQVFIAGGQVPEVLQPIREVLHGENGQAEAARRGGNGGPVAGRARVSLHLLLDDGAREVEIEVPGRHYVSPAIRERLAALPGVVNAIAS
ncbi:MAG: DNA polymerase III subunit alpha [Sphingomonadales bacterium]